MEDNKANITPGQGQPDNNERYIGIGILSFLIPLAGWIIFGVNRKDNPRKAEVAWKAAWWGFGIGVFCNLIYTYGLAE